MLCSEGVTDQGHDQYVKEEYLHEDGVLQILMHKLADGQELIFVVKTRGDIKRFPILPNKFENKSKLKAKKLAALAQKEKCTHIAYHRDEDNNGFDAMYKQVHEYFIDAESKGKHCLAIVPMHMTENWLLADEGAFPTKPVSPALPRHPETTWGDKGSDTHPKKYLQNVLKQFHMKSSADTYVEIAQKIDIDVLLQKCSVSFRRFSEDMKRFV